MSDDWRSSYRPASRDYGAGYGRSNGSQDHQNGNGASGRAGGNGSAGYGSGRGGANANGNGYGSARPGNGASRADNGYRPAGSDGGASGDRSVPGGRRVASGRHGTRQAGQDGGADPAEDTGAWYRPAGRYGSARTATRRSARPGYGPDGRTALGARTGRYGPYGPGGPGAGPGGPGNRRPGQRRGERDIRALVDPDGRTPLPLKILRRLWYGRWWRHWTFKKVGLLFGALCATMALVLVATFFVMLHSTKVPATLLSNRAFSQSSLVYFSNGKVVGCFCTSGRFSLTEDQIKKSQILVHAVLAAEDRSFFSEGGISVSGLLRAAKNDLSGGSLQGGSTITEQFVKTYYDQSLIGHVSYSTKIKEIFVAIKLAQSEPKWWILTHYLNDIPLGSGANGVQAAAETYFGRSAWKLTVAQAAMIAAMIQLPYGYQPDNPTSTAGLPNSLLERWVYVLTNMVRDGDLTQAQFNGLVPDPNNPGSKVNLKEFPKLRTSSLQSNWTGYRGYIMNLVANELAANYNIKVTTAQLGNMGLQIHTTINERLMNRLYSAINQDKREMASLGVHLPSYVNISAVLEKPGTGKILAFYGGLGFGVKHCKRLHCSFNNILAGEPVGSSFKPYVLATAISQGMDVRKSVLNSHSPLCIPMDFPPYRYQLSKQTRTCNTHVGYWPFNEPTENFKTNLNPWEATAVSNDPAFLDLIHRTGVQNVINMAQTLGVSTQSVDGLNALFGDHCHRPCFSGAVNSALGEGSLTAVDQANTFSVLVSGGRLVTPHIIKSVSENGVPLATHLVDRQAIPPAVAADTDYGLSFDTSQTPVGSGTGVPNAVWDRPMIAKTGTLGQGQITSEAWFVGAIPQYSLAIGMFTNKPGGAHPQILNGLPTIGTWPGEFGGAWPATMWHTFMSETFSNLPVQQLPPASFTGNNPTFTKWILALPPKKKHKRCRQFQGGGGGQGGPGGGNGNGHHHALVFQVSGGQGNQQCQGGGPNPTNSPNPTPTSPSPTPTSPSPTPTTTSPSPSNSPNPSPSSTLPPGPLAVVPHRQRVPTPTVDTATLSVFATLPKQLISKPASVVTSSLV